MSMPADRTDVSIKRIVLLLSLIHIYGDPPRTVNNLISVAILRSRAAECGISEIVQKGERLLFVLAQVDFQKVSVLCGGPAYRGRLLFSAGEKPHLSLRLKKGEDPLKVATRLVAVSYTHLDVYKRQIKVQWAAKRRRAKAKK